MRIPIILAIAFLLPLAAGQSTPTVGVVSADQLFEAEPGAEVTYRASYSIRAAAGAETVDMTVRPNGMASVFASHVAFRPASSSEYTDIGSFDAAGDELVMRGVAGGEYQFRVTATVPLDIASGLHETGITVLVRDPASGRTSSGAAMRVGIEVPNLPPVAVFTTDVSGLQVAFSAAGSSDPEGGPLRFVWDFGDGTTGAGSAPEHTYTVPLDTTRSFVVGLQVTDDQGQSAHATRTLSLSATAPPENIDDLAEQSSKQPAAPLWIVGAAGASLLAAAGAAVFFLARP